MRLRDLALCAAFLLAGCGVPDDQAREALAAYGFTDVRLGDPSPWYCGKDDSFGSEFTATGPTGVRVRGVICSGMLKGATVRITGRA